MKKYKPVDLNKIKTCSVKSRATKVDLSAFAKPSAKGKSFREFYDALPRFFAVEDLQAVAKAMVLAHKKGRPVIVGMGAHVIKVGLNPLLIDLMKKGVINCIALNGAGAIHDFEVATLGRTSEEVGAGLATGMFGMVEETMREMNQAIITNDQYLPMLRSGSRHSIIRNNNVVGTMTNEGMGALLGKKLLKNKAPYRKLSILAAGVELDIPVTVHVAIGTDTIHMSPHVDPKALGAATFTDFRLLSSVICDLEGGVYINLGSAVLLPEVFLKALTVARNLGHKIKHFTTVNMDMLRHYRPQQNVLTRPGGKAYALTGHHEIMFPLLYQAVIEAL